MEQEPFKIFMVDDAERYHSRYEMAITDVLDATVSFATDGLQALEMLRDDNRFDLMVLDLNLPGKNGEEVLAEIRQDVQFDNMPVVILTGDTNLETQSRLLDLGADDFIEKGAPPEILVARLRAQMRHKLALDRLTEMALDMDVFAAGVLHDMRNLETAIIGLTELNKQLLEEDPAENKDMIVQNLNSLVEQAERLGRYANDVISWVRETGSTIDSEPQNIKKHIQWIKELLNSNQGGKLEVTIPEDLSQVMGDKNLLRLALLNLIQNSVKYARPEEPPKLVLSQTQSESGGRRMVTTRIRDYGKGIKKSDLRKVFQPFVRSGKKTTQSGFGLGLALVAKVVSKMGGRVWAETPEEGPGAVMCIQLPKPSSQNQ